MLFLQKAPIGYAQDQDFEAYKVPAQAKQALWRQTLFSMHAFSFKGEYQRVR